MIKLLIADDHAVVRLGLKGIFEGKADLQVVGEAANGNETLAVAKTTRPDVVLLDVSMPGAGGIETARALKQAVSGLRILFLTVHPEDQFALRCIREGGDGYLMKTAPPDELVSAVRQVARGHKYITPSLAERLADALSGDLSRSPDEILSQRELQVLQSLASGKTVTQTAAALNLSPKTVSTYRTRILEKLGLRTTAEIIRYGVEHGLVSE